MADVGNEHKGPDARSRILAAASVLVAEGGIAALTTRAVAAAASVQAPTLYRLFGDKNGLLDAVAEHGLATYVADKLQTEPHPDPVMNLCAAWHEFVSFGLANPAVFAIMNDVGRSGPPSPAALAGIAVLRERVERIARAGRLRVPEDRAVALIHAVGTGTVSTLLSTPAQERDQALSRLALEGVMAVIVGEPAAGAENSVTALAIGLRAHLNETEALSPGERQLMGEWLDRLAGERQGGGCPREERT